MAATGLVLFSAESSRHSSAWIGVRREDGGTRVVLTNALTLNNTWQFFMGYRFGIFNHATQSLGGAVTVRRFDLTTP